MCIRDRVRGSTPLRSVAASCVNRALRALRMTPETGRSRRLHPVEGHEGAGEAGPERDHEMRTLVHAVGVALGTPQRRPELLALRWSGIDLGAGGLRVLGDYHSSTLDSWIPSPGRTLPAAVQYRHETPSEVRHRRCGSMLARARVLRTHSDATGRRGVHHGRQAPQHPRHLG